jgi:hypothetical protein
MSVSANKMLTRLAKEFGVSVESVRFNDTVLDAINDSIDWLNEYTSLDLDPITNTNSIIDVDRVYLQCLMAGARRSVASSGEWGRKPDGDLIALHRKELAFAQTKYQEDTPPDVGPYEEDDDDDDDE